MSTIELLNLIGAHTNIVSISFFILKQTFSNNIPHRTSECVLYVTFISAFLVSCCPLQRILKIRGSMYEYN
jgi:hypothetical protein